jgi:Fic family protein
VGRALIHLVLRRRGVVSRVLPPVSLILATWAEEYVDALTATRYRGAATSRAAQEGLNRWVGLFATAARRAVADADAFEERVSFSSWPGASVSAACVLTRPLICSFAACQARRS